MSAFKESKMRSAPLPMIDVLQNLKDAVLIPLRDLLYNDEGLVATRAVRDVVKKCIAALVRDLGRLESIAAKPMTRYSITQKQCQTLLTQQQQDQSRLQSVFEQCDLLRKENMKLRQEARDWERHYWQIRDAHQVTTKRMKFPQEFGSDFEREGEKSSSKDASQISERRVSGLTKSQLVPLARVPRLPRHPENHLGENSAIRQSKIVVDLRRKLNSERMQKETILSSLRRERTKGASTSAEKPDIGIKAPLVYPLLTHLDSYMQQSHVTDNVLQALKLQSESEAERYEDFHLRRQLVHWQHKTNNLPLCTSLNTQEPKRSFGNRNASGNHNAGPKLENIHLRPGVQSEHTLHGPTPTKVETRAMT